MNEPLGTATLIERRLREQLSAEEVHVVDDSAHHIGHPGAKSGGHYSVTVVSPVFRGLGMLQRHRLVYEALGNMMKTDIHALSVRALTPEDR